MTLPLKWGILVLSEDDKMTEKSIDDAKRKQILDDLTLWHQCLGFYDSEGDIISPELAEERRKMAEEIEARWSKDND